MRILLFLLMSLLSARVAIAASVRGHALVFSNATARTPGRRALADDRGLWYVRAGSDPPPNLACREAVAAGVYLVRGAPDPALEAGEWTPEMKFDPAMRTRADRAFPGMFAVHVRTDAASFAWPGCAVSRAGPGRFAVACAPDVDAAQRLRDLAADDRVLWISAVSELMQHSYEARTLILGANSPLNGSGTLAAVSDTGIDWKHAAFYEGSAPPYGSVNSARAKIVGVLSTGSDYSAVDGAHGTKIASILGGFANWFGTRGGAAPLAKIWFLDNSAGDRYVTVPWNYEELVLSSGADVNSASWGSANGGVYSDLDARRDTLAYDDPYMVHVASAGNDGPTGVLSVTAKNVIIAGACMSAAADYPTFSPTQRAQQPELYAHTSQLDFSSRGPAADGSNRLHLCAPGFQVPAAHALGSGTANHASSSTCTGTSCSCPVCSGIACVLIQKHKLENAGARPLGVLIEAQMAAHADPPVRVVGTASPTTMQTVSAPAITTMGTPRFDFARFTNVPSGSVTSATRQAFCFENADAAPWTVVLRWRDVPAVEGASPAIVNDLDMVLAGASSGARVVDDDLETYEVVRDWAPQHTRVVVLAYDGVTTFGTQTFALHLKAKATAVACASTTLPSEYGVGAACGSGMVRYVSSWKGDTACDYRTCPSTSCGADCARACGSGAACTPANGRGSGRMLSGVCRPTTCPEPYFVGDAGCVCKAGTGQTCANGQIAMCDAATGEFGACPASLARSSLTSAQTGSARRPGLGATILGLVAALTTLLAR